LLGGAIHTTAGFGSALVAMPILTLVVHPVVATPLQTAVGLGLSGLILYQHRAKWPWPDAVPLVAASIAGIPLGTYVITHLAESTVLGALGVVLLLYACFELLGRRTPAYVGVTRDPFLLGSAIAGFLSGVLGSAYATNGPPAIIYGSLRRWPPGEFRSALQSLFFVNGICILLWQGGNGLLTKEVGWYACFAAPGLILGAFIGYKLDKYIDHKRFRTIVIGLMFLLGVLLLFRALN